MKWFIEKKKKNLMRCVKFEISFLIMRKGFPKFQIFYATCKT